MVWVPLAFLRRLPKENRQSIHGQRQVKGFLKRPSAERAVELLSLSRKQLTIRTGLLTGHSFTAMSISSGTHILCDCQALAVLRFRHWPIISYNQVSTLTSPSASFKVRNCTKTEKSRCALPNADLSYSTNVPICSRSSQRRDRRPARYFLHTELCATVSLTMSSIAWTLRGRSTEILT
jgi:hypothetical protein